MEIYQNEKNKKNDQEKIVELPDEECILKLQKKIKKLKEKLKICKEEKAKYLDGWQREKAAFINYKKEERERILKEGELQKEKILKEMVLILDDFEKAFKELPNDLKENLWIKGIYQIETRFKKILKNSGVKEMEVKKGEDFNPLIHEAIEIGEGEEGKILSVIQKGYFWQERVLRPAKVKVGKKTKP